MKKILNTVTVCALALFVLSISDVLAVDTTKLVNKEYRINGDAKSYDENGNYNGCGQITQGALFFYNPEDNPAVYAFHNVAPDRYMFSSGVYEYYCVTQLGSYTPRVDKITATECSMDCYDAAGSGVLSFFGACTAKIIFSSNTAFTATITIPDYWGETTGKYVLTLNGKFMGRYPAITDGIE